MYFINIIEGFISKLLILFLCSASLLLSGCLASHSSLAGSSSYSSYDYDDDDDNNDDDNYDSRPVPHRHHQGKIYMLDNKMI